MRHEDQVTMIQRCLELIKARQGDIGDNVIFYPCSSP